MAMVVVLVVVALRGCGSCCSAHCCAEDPESASRLRTWKKPFVGSCRCLERTLITCRWIGERIEETKIDK